MSLSIGTGVAALIAVAVTALALLLTWDDVTATRAYLAGGLTFVIAESVVLFAFMRRRRAQE